jgi:hypothetical protein
MKFLVAAAFCLSLCFLISSASAQETQPALHIDARNPDRIQIEQTLQRYLGAYQRRSLPDLVAVWPELQNQKKEYEKIRRHFDDGNISDEQVILEPLQTESTSDGAIVYARRTEQFVKTERTSSIAMGDLRAGALPAQDPGPHVTEKKKDVKKSATLWIKLHRKGDAWTINSIGEQKPCCVPAHVLSSSSSQTE